MAGIEDHSKLYVEKEVRITPQVLAFFEERQQKFELRQTVQVGTALGFIKSQVFVSVYLVRLSLSMKLTYDGKTGFRSNNIFLEKHTSTVSKFTS